MSLGSMFSSPGKQATQASQAELGAAKDIIAQQNQYVDEHQQQLRDAISQQGPNPYFAAAQQLNPQAYFTDPSRTTTFGNRGPGTSVGQPLTANPSPNPPPLPNTILGAPPQAQPPSSNGGGVGTQGPGDGNGPVVGPPITRFPPRQIEAVGPSSAGDPGSGPLIDQRLAPSGQRNPFLRGLQ